MVQPQLLQQDKPLLLGRDVTIESVPDGEMAGGSVIAINLMHRSHDEVAMFIDIVDRQIADCEPFTYVREDRGVLHLFTAETDYSYLHELFNEVVDQYNIMVSQPTMNASHNAAVGRLMNDRASTLSGNTDYPISQDFRPDRESAVERLKAERESQNSQVSMKLR